jgi:hypothetical protein
MEAAGFDLRDEAQDVVKTNEIECKNLDAQQV